MAPGDGEVNFGFFGETNLDEVGKRMEEALEDVADEVEDVASNATIAEHTVDSLSTTFAEAAGISDSFADELDEVSDEMNKVVLSSQAASASVAQLGATMQATDVGDFGELADNLDQASRTMKRGFEEGLGEFVGQPAMATDPQTLFAEQGARQRFKEFTDIGETPLQSPERSALQGAMAGRFSNLKEFGERLNEVSDESLTINKIIGGYAEAFDSAADSAEMLAREMPDVDDDVITDRLKQDLQPRRSVMNAGILKGILGARETVGGAARGLAESRETTSDPVDVLESMIRGVDEKELSDALTRAGPDEVRLPPPQFSRDPALPEGEGVRALPRGRDFPALPEPSAIPDFPPALPEGDRRPALPGPPELPEGDRRPALPAPSAIPDFPPALEEPGPELRQRDAVRIGPTGPFIRDDQIRRLRQFNDALQHMTGINVAGTLDNMSARFDKMRSSIGPLRNEFNEMSEIALKTDTSLGFLTANLARWVGDADDASQAADRLDDDFKDLADRLSNIIPAINNVSANLGPFNISLTNLAVTLPALIGSVGLFVSVLGSLAGALITVVGAFGALLAVGALGFAEELKNNFAGIETTADAMKAIFEGLKNAVVEALAPLEGVTIGGLGPTGIFVTVLQDIVTLINMFAEASAELINMKISDEFGTVGDSLLRLRAALLGFSDATSGMTMMEGMRKMVAAALPVLENLLVWFIDVLPEFMAFVGTITEEAAPAIADLTNSLIHLAAIFTHVAASISTQLLPALALVFDLTAAIFSGLMTLERLLGGVSELFIAVAFTVTGLVLVFVKLITVLNTALTLWATVNEISSEAADIIADNDESFDSLTEAIRKNNGALAKNIKFAAIAVGRFVLVAAGIALILDAFGLLDPVLNGIITAVGMAIGVFDQFKETIGGIPVIGEELKGVIQSLSELIVGTALVSVGLYGVGLKGLAVSAFEAASGLFTTAAGVSAVNAAMTAGIIGGLIFIAAGLMHIADIAGTFEAVVTGVIAVLGGLAAAIVAVQVGLAGLTAALIATGVGAIVVALGIAALMLAQNWDKVAAAFEDSMSIFDPIAQTLNSIVEDMKWLGRQTGVIETPGQQNMGQGRGSSVMERSANPQLNRGGQRPMNPMMNTGASSSGDVNVTVNNEGSSDMDARQTQQLATTVEQVQNRRRENESGQ